MYNDMKSRGSCLEILENSQENIGRLLEFY